MNESSTSAQVVAREYLLETTAPMARELGWHETAAAIEAAACGGLPDLIVDQIIDAVAGIAEPFIAQCLDGPHAWRFITVDLQGRVRWWSSEEMGR